MSTTVQLQGVVADHIAAVNAFDTQAIVATFADDALVNDNHREFSGTDRIGAWVASEMVGDNVTIVPVEAFEHHGMTIVRGRYDGDYDKAGLPDELILTNYFEIENDRIVSLIVIHNRG
jgi:limonene-1,2-epoxide hydrolase